MLWATTSPKCARPSMPDSCELCEAARMTEWFYEDDVCWIAECEQCYVPMVVWKTHDPSPPDDVRDALLQRLGDCRAGVVPIRRLLHRRQHALDTEPLPRPCAATRRVLRPRNASNHLAGAGQNLKTRTSRIARLVRLFTLLLPRAVGRGGSWLRRDQVGVTMGRRIGDSFGFVGGRLRRVVMNISHSVTSFATCLTRTCRNL